MRKLMISTGAFALLASFGQAPAMADSLTLYCAADEAWCQLMARRTSRRRPASRST